MALPETLIETLLPWLAEADREEVRRYVRVAGGALREQDALYPQEIFDAAWNDAFDQAEQAWSWQARQLLGPAQALRVLTLLANYDPSSIVARIQKEQPSFAPRFSEPPKELATRLSAMVENAAFFSVVELADDVRVYAQSIASLGADAAGYIGEQATALQLQLDAALSHDEHVPFNSTLTALSGVRELTQLLTFLPPAEVAVYNESRDVLQITAFAQLVAQAAQCARMILARPDLTPSQVVDEVLVRQMLERFLVNLESGRSADANAIELPEQLYERMVTLSLLQDGTAASELRGFVMNAKQEQVDLVVELAIGSPEYTTLLAPNDVAGVLQQLLQAKPGSAAAREVRERVLSRYEEGSLKQQVAGILEILEILATYVRS